MNPPRPVKAFLFDLDGTLVDTEPCTDAAITEVMARRGHAGVRLPPAETSGHTWADIVETLLAKHPGAAGPADPTDPAALERDLLETWVHLADRSEPVPGAPEAVLGASAHGCVAVVSSSPRSVIDTFLVRLGVERAVPAELRIGAGAVSRSKPDPEGYLLAARRCGAAPADCLVFEDSHAGLLAARAAGMRAILILHGASSPDLLRPLADAAWPDYRGLPPGVWADLAAGLVLPPSAG